MPREAQLGSHERGGGADLAAVLLVLRRGTARLAGCALT